jgi:hypothetical protein
MNTPELPFILRTIWSTIVAHLNDRTKEEWLNKHLVQAIAGCDDLLDPQLSISFWWQYAYWLLTDDEAGILRFLHEYESGSKITIRIADLYAQRSQDVNQWREVIRNGNEAMKNLQRQQTEKREESEIAAFGQIEAIALEVALHIAYAGAAIAESVRFIASIVENQLAAPATTEGSGPDLGRQIWMMGQTFATLDYSTGSAVYSAGIAFESEAFADQIVETGDETEANRIKARSVAASAYDVALIRMAEKLLELLEEAAAKT